MIYLACSALLLNATAAALVVIPHLRTRRAIRARLAAIKNEEV